MNYRIEKDTIFMTLAKGNLINKTFEAYAESHDIGCAWIHGIGALENPEIGYYYIETKSYHHNKFSGYYEFQNLFVAYHDNVLVFCIF